MTFPQTFGGTLPLICQSKWHMLTKRGPSLSPLSQFKPPVSYRLYIPNNIIRSGQRRCPIGLCCINLCVIGLNEIQVFWMSPSVITQRYNSPRSFFEGLGSWFLENNMNITDVCIMSIGCALCVMTSTATGMVPQGEVAPGKLTQWTLSSTARNILLRMRKASKLRCEENTLWNKSRYIDDKDSLYYSLWPIHMSTGNNGKHVSVCCLTLARSARDKLSLSLE